MTTGKTERPILVTGAAGKTGQAVIRALSAKGAPIRAFVRQAKHRETVEGLGVDQVVEGDLRGREAVAAAVDGIESIHHICPNMHPNELGIARRVVAAALNAGVQRFVYHSVLHPQVEAMPHHWAKMRVEELLFEARLDHTILQPAPYMQNLLGQWRSISDQAIYAVPYGLDSRVVMVDLEDVAEAAARVLTETGHVGATYELCGPDLLDQQQIAVALGRGLGKSVRARSVPPREWTEGARAAGLDDYQVETLLAMFEYYESFGMVGTPRVLECLLDRSPTSFAEFVTRTVAAGAG